MRSYVIPLKEILFSSDYYGTFARLIGSMSLLVLIKYAFQHIIGFPFSLLVADILDFYDAFIGYILYLIDPLVRGLINIINYYFSIDIELYEHWKHFAFLIGIYFSRSVFIAFKNDKRAAYFRIVLGILLAVSGGALSGMFQLSDDNFLQNFAITVWPILVIYLYGVINGVFAAFFQREREKKIRPTENSKSRWSIFAGHAKAAWRRTWVGYIILCVGLAGLVFFGVPRPSIIMLIVLILAFSIYFLRDGAKQAKRDHAVNWPEYYWKAESSMLAASMIGVFAWSILVASFDYLLSLAL